MFRFSLAHELHKTLAEIMEMTEAELVYWAGYFRVREKQKRG